MAFGNCFRFKMGTHPGKHPGQRLQQVPHKDAPPEPFWGEQPEEYCGKRDLFAGTTVKSYGILFFGEKGPAKSQIE